MSSLLALALAASAAAPKAPKPVAPPKPWPLPALRGAPLVGSPSFTPDGAQLLVSRFAAAGGARATRGDLYLVDAKRPRRERALPVAGASEGGRYSARLSWDGKQIAYLASGELWLRPVAESGADAAPRRLYPPEKGDAPLGPKLDFALWSPDGSWLLLQSPLGWGRVAVQSGEVAALGLKPVDLTGGSLAMSPDGVHVAFVRPERGPGWANGVKVIALNLETGQAQLADFDHDYVETLVLPDGQLLGEDSGGELWVLRGSSRLSYFKPPPQPEGTTVGQYALAFDLSRIAFVATRGSGAAQRDELWIGVAPLAPPRPKLPGPRDAAPSTPGAPVPPSVR